MPVRLFIFIQLEFPWALGPADGRYLLRLQPDAEPERVVVFDTLAASRATRRGSSDGGIASIRGRLGARAPAPEVSADPAPVTTTRVTVIDPISLSAEQQARAWLDEPDRERDVLAAVAIVNRVLHLHRIATADPHVHEVSPTQALVVRAGWGEGEQVASGRWMHARELPLDAPRRRASRARPGASRARSQALRPQERLAALLGARSTALLCEELALRARLDLDQGRLVPAAIELDGALAAAVPELRGEGRQDLALRIDELHQLHEGVAAQASLARPSASAEGDLSAGGDPRGASAAVGTSAADGAGVALDEDLLIHALERLEAALRARSATGFSLK
jgi:hypothetical protein